MYKGYFGILPHLPNALNNETISLRRNRSSVFPIELLSSTIDGFSVESNLPENRIFKAVPRP